MPLTANKDVELREPKTMDYPVAASTKIYAGSMVSVNSSNNAIPSGDTASTKFVGIAKDMVDNSAGSAGDKRVVVHRNGVAKLATAATFAVGDVACVSDDANVTTAALATNDIAVGRVVRVDSGAVQVDLRERS